MGFGPCILPLLDLEMESAFGNWNGYLYDLSLTYFLESVSKNSAQAMWDSNIDKYI
jgi:hypothetical protein